MIAAILEFIADAVIFVFMLALTLGMVYALKFLILYIMGDTSEDYE